MKRFRTLLLAGSLVLAVGGGFVAYQVHHMPVAHASCTGDCLDNTDPGGTLCNQDAYLQTPVAYTSWGYVQNWFSASCSTNWTVVQAYSGYWIIEAEAVRCDVNPAPCQVSDAEQLYYSTIADCYQSTCQDYGGIYGNHPPIPYNAQHWYTNQWYSPNGGGTCVKSVAYFAKYNTTQVVGGPVFTSCF